MKRTFVLLIALVLVVSPLQTAWAGPTASSVASALIPGVGQIMNDDHHTKLGMLKIATMWLIEIGAIITTPILGSKYGFPIVMVGVGIFVLNHAWSAWDAYEGAQPTQEVPLEGSNVR